jgi:hypothetical protein
MASELKVDKILDGSGNAHDFEQYKAVRPIFKCYPESTPSLGTAWADMTWSGVEIDTTSAYNSGTGVYTVQKSGYYTVNLSIYSVISGNDGKTYARVVKNGADNILYVINRGTSVYDSNIASNVSNMWLDAGDELKLQGLDYAGTIAAGAYYSSFEVTWLG